MKSFQKSNIATVCRDGKTIRYVVPNEVTKWRVNTLFQKEPSTIDWLERLDNKSVLLDIGANVGMYSIYAAAKQQAKVIAVEPESQNFAILCKNIEANNLGNLIMPLCAGASDIDDLTTLYLSDFLWDGGGSCHSVGQEVGHDLKPRKAAFRQYVMQFRIDSAISKKWLDKPTAIKVDVDGNEHLVVEGALETLAKEEVRTLSIEVNFNLGEHHGMIEKLNALGFYYCQEQVEKALRREGAFKGCAEVIFDRVNTSHILVTNSWGSPGNSSKSGEARIAFEHAMNRIKAIDVEKDPFPAIYVEDIFPRSYYNKMLQHFPSNHAMKPLGLTGRVTEGAYPERNVTLFDEAGLALLEHPQGEFWDAFAVELSSDRFVRTCIQKFSPWCSNRLALLQGKDEYMKVESDSLLVSDRTNYAIGPHTDHKQRLLSLLFYLPKDESMKHLGTSFYKHKDSSFVCPGGPHYSFEDFDRLGSAPFIPNSLLMFVRTGRSFHGVEPIRQPGVHRQLLISNIRTV
jgi:FkbM family methyltransferase